VRFASVNEEIEPVNLDAVQSSQAVSGNDVDKLKEISKSLHGTHLQERRMSHFAFEPVSLPASRVCILFSYLSNPGHPKGKIGRCVLNLHEDLSHSQGEVRRSAVSLGSVRQLHYMH
jgi:hypothetical protein